MERIENKKGNCLDGLRLIAAGLVIANHTSPLALIDPTADFLLTRVLARLAVPFFFMLTGAFVLSERTETPSERTRRIGRWAKRILEMYGAAIALYFPINLYAGQIGQNLLEIAQDLFLNGTFYHLWYFPAVLIGTLLVNEMARFMSAKTLLISTLVLYLIALGADSYYGLVSAIPFLRAAYDRLFLLFETTRNGFLFAPLFLVLGKQIKESAKPLPAAAIRVGFGISLGLLVIEGLTLHHLDVQRYDVMYLALVPTAYFLFRLGLTQAGKIKPAWRHVSMLIYLLHPMMILVVRVVGKLGTLKTLLVDNHLVLFLFTAALSYGVSFFLVWAWERTRPIPPSKKGRAWIEIDSSALANNVSELSALLSERTKIIGVIKAQAYGHGGVEIARQLERNGIDFLAVATVQEAVELRENGIKADVLILGYTAPQDFACLSSYDLIQTVIDRDYARQMNRFSKKLRAHVAIDTGMHRLGISFDDTASIEEVYQMKGLKIEGIFTHLCVADSVNPQDEQFTRLQFARFDGVVDHLKASGFDPGKTHVQSSFGLLNYPEFHYDYVRLGIALFTDVAQEKITARPWPRLLPVLTLKCRIVSIRDIQAQETVGYGRMFTAKKDSRIAVLSIGYGDGVDRACSGMSVLIRGQKAPIIGRICMDQCMADITGLCAAVGDEVTLIGSEGTDAIDVEQWAKQSGTISNETLSRLGARLPRVVK